MFDYNIRPIADNQVFTESCEKIERHFLKLKKGQLIADVDGTLIQIYTDSYGNTIKVFNDYEIDAVYAVSDIDLAEIPF